MIARSKDSGMGHPCRCLSVCRLSGLDVTLQLLVKVLPGTGQDDHHHLAVLLIDAVGDLIIGLVVVDIVAINSRQISGLAFTGVGILSDGFQGLTKRILNRP